MPGSERIRVTFWGTRGSIPAPISGAKIRLKLINALVKAAGQIITTEDEAASFVDTALTFPESRGYGGNSSCVEIETGREETLFCDFGTGARELGNAMLAKHGPKPQTYHVLMSHVHWDHIMGFPFFVPAYIPGNKLYIYGCHHELEAAFRTQHHGPNFPVEFNQLGATIEFIELTAGQSIDICGFKVTPKLQLHANDSYGYRLEKNGKTIVYATDSEHKLEDAPAIEAVVAHFHHADLVIFDAMYSLADAASLKEDWGHSSNIVGVELAQLARARHLVLYHHEPAFDDHRIYEIFQETLRYEAITRQEHPVQVTAAYDGLVIDL